MTKKWYSMERRTVMRRGADVTTYIYPRTMEGPLRCRAHNLSADGVFIKTEHPISRPGEVFSLVFALEFDRVVRTYRRWARVAHCTEDGMGVQLFREHPEIRESA